LRNRIKGSCWEHVHLANNDHSRLACDPLKSFEPDIGIYRLKQGMRNHGQLGGTSCVA